MGPGAKWIQCTSWNGVLWGGAHPNSGALGTFSVCSPLSNKGAVPHQALTGHCPLQLQCTQAEETSSNQEDSRLGDVGGCRCLLLPQPSPITRPHHTKRHGRVSNSQELGPHTCPFGSVKLFCSSVAILTAACPGPCCHNPGLMRKDRSLRMAKPGGHAAPETREPLGQPGSLTQRVTGEMPLCSGCWLKLRASVPTGLRGPLPLLPSGIRTGAAMERPLCSFLVLALPFPGKLSHSFTGA